MENNSSYSSVSDQAKKGLSTFVLTLSVSLIVFSTIYYLMTAKSSNVEEAPNPISAVTVKDENEAKSSDTDSQNTVFGELASVDPKTSYGQVLAGADEVVDDGTGTAVTQTTQSGSSLETGTVSITVGLVFSLAVFILTLVFVSKNPRRLALTSFEKKTTKDL